MTALKLNLQLFAEGGEGAGEAGTDAQGEAQQAAEAAAKHAEDWNNLIKGDFREDYEKAIKSHVDRRFKHQAELEEQIGRSQKLVAFLSERYGTDDEQGILDAIMNDDALFEKEAAERGLNVDQYKEFKRLEFDKQQADAELEEIERQRAVQATYEEWVHQSEALKQLYPDFDLETELANDKFASLLSNNIDMQTAYQVCHMNDVITGAMATTAKTVAERVTDSIRAKGLRPLENGIGSASQPVSVKTDINNMSLDDMKNLARRAARGETITLR
jgi:hypothetical protein